MMEGSESNRPCYFFKRGKCWFGDRCRYSHDISRFNQGPCYYFINFGSCNYGSNCRYYHPASSDPLPGSSADDPEAHSTREISGANSTVSHHSPAHSNLLSSTNPLQCNSPEKEACRSPLPFIKVECGICLEEISKTEEKTYGILPNCPHSFCFDCILKWRKQNDYQTDVRNSCPHCRIISNFILKSKNWFEGEAKEKYVTRFLQRASQLHCKKFKRGKGWCRFQEQCIYKHIMYDGSEPNYERLRRKHNPIHLDFENVLLLLEARLEVRYGDDIDYESLDNFGLDDDDDEMEQFHFYHFSSDEEDFPIEDYDEEEVVEDRIISSHHGFTDEELDLIRMQNPELYEEIMRQTFS